MKKLLIVPVAGLMVLLLSSCFVMQGFSVSATSVVPGKGTKAQFVLHPASTSASKYYEFVIVGVDDGGDLAVGKATWGTNGKFGGPLAMSYRSNLDDFVASDGSCSNYGFTFSSATGVTWKGFLTPNQVNDKGKVDTKVVVQVGVKASSSATSGAEPVIGVSGSYQDLDEDGNLSAGDIYFCTGMSSVTLYVK